MGQRISQRILTCSTCERVPEDGEDLWEMCGSFICANCIDKEEEEGEAERSCTYCGEESCDCDML